MGTQGNLGRLHSGNLDVLIDLCSRDNWTDMQCNNGKTYFVPPTLPLLLLFIPCTVAVLNIVLGVSEKLDY